MDTTPPPVLLDAAAIGESKQLLGDKFEKIAGYFFEDSTLYVQQVEQAFARADLEGLVAPAHTLKSSSRQMGAPQLSALAEMIEHKARELIKEKGDIQTLQPFIPSLKSTLSDTLDIYRKYLAG